VTFVEIGRRGSSVFRERAILADIPRVSESHSALGQFPAFDWLRFILASVVVLDHAGWSVWEHGGNFAVQTFFALSGWLIGSILLSITAADLPRFFFNRATRIWIPYVFAVFAIYALAYLKGTEVQHFLKSLFYDLTFTHNWFIPKTPDVIANLPLQGTGSHFWSIAVEEQFYLAAPLLMMFVPHGKSASFWALVSAVAFLVAPGWYGAISLGVLAAALRRDYGAWYMTPVSRMALATAVLSIGLLLLSRPESYEALAPFAAIAIVLLLAFEGQRQSVGTFLGGMSYPFYLNHWIGIFFMNLVAKKLGVEIPGQALLAYLVSFITCSAIYVAIDVNVQRYRSVFFDKTVGKVFAANAYTLCAAGVFGGLIVGLGI
jgi:peptidoglycan/LPS O-acetylase OafA/YrhL